MKLYFSILFSVCLLVLSSTQVNANTPAIFDFTKAPFKAEISKQQLRTMLSKGAIRATLAVPTYISLVVEGNLVSGVAPAQTDVLFVPNDDDDYYTVVPITGGSNVSQKQQTSDFGSSPHIQLIWYFRNGEYDAVYSLISLNKQ